MSFRQVSTNINDDSVSDCELPLTKILQATSLKSSTPNETNDENNLSTFQLSLTKYLHQVAL